MNTKKSRRPDLGGRSTVFGRRGAVACEHPDAALAAIRTLDAGGTAADACVAMAACMAVLSPMATGMGGDAFLLNYEAEAGRITGANGSGRAPRSATIEKLRDRDVKVMPERGGLSVTVPGAVRLWEDAANSLGRLPFSQLLEPAYELADEGSPVSEVVARYWEINEWVLRQSKAATEVFLPEGRPPRPGEVFRQPDLARTLAAVADNGAEPFYNGEIARNIARSVQDAGGYVTEEDLAAHESTWVEADLHRLPGHSGLRDPTARTGHRRPPDAQHPRRNRPLRPRPVGRRAHPPRSRSQKTRLPRLARQDRRPGLRRRTDRRATLQRIRCEVARENIFPGRRFCFTGSRRRHHLPLRRGRRG